MTNRWDTTWTAETIALLRTLWGEGHSGEEIGRRMRLSKNAVVGKAHRLGLPRRPSPIVSSSVLPRGKDRDAAIIRLRDKGLTRTQIANSLRISVETLDKTLARLGLPPLVNARPQGAAALARAQATTEALRAEAPRRDPQPGGETRAAHPIPAPAGDPGPAGCPGVAGSAGGCATGVSSLDLPSAVPPARPRGSSVPRTERTCRWPMWPHGARSTGVFCGAAVRVKPDGALCAYCAEHAARAFSRVRDPDAEEHRITRSTFAWGGQAA